MLSPLSQSPDANDPMTIPTLLYNTSIVDSSAIGGFNTVETINLGCSPSKRYSSRLRPSSAELIPPPSERHTYPGSICGGENEVCDRSTHQAGCNDAVLRKEVLSSSTKEYEYNPGRPKLHHRQSATVISADAPAYYNPLPRQTRDPLVSLGDVSACPNANLQGSTVLRSNLVQRLVTVGRRMVRIWSWTLIGRLEPAIVYIPSSSAGPRPLHRSLFTSTRNLKEDFLELKRCLFFLVGVDFEGQEDAENDIKYLGQMFESAIPVAQYECIYGPDTTYAKIRETALALLNRARAISGPSHMFVVITGTGGDNNAMYLSNGEVFSGSDVNQWFSSTSIHQAKKLNIGVLFDICRTAASRLATVFRSIGLAWSCSTGEYAYAIRTSKHKLIPRSIFLLAIFLAAHDTTIRGLDSRFFEAAFKFHIQQLNDLILFLYHKDHRGRCSRCPPHGQCDPPKAQNPDLQQAKGVVTDLGMVIATHFPQHASEVFLAVARKMKKEGFEGRLCPLSLFRAEQVKKPKVNDES